MRAWIRAAGLSLLALSGACKGGGEPAWQPKLDPEPANEPLGPPPAPTFDIGTAPGKARCAPVGDGHVVAVEVGSPDRWSRFPMAPLAKPAFGETYIDPVFKTKIRRVSDRTRLGADRFEVNTYAQLQAISADSAYLLTTSDAGFKLRCVDSARLLTDVNLSHVNVPRWHPVLAHLLIHYDTNADDVVKVQSTNVTTGEVTDIATLPGYTKISANQSFDELSHDGAWMAGVATTATGDKEIFSFDLSAKKLGARLSLKTLFSKQCQRPDDWDKPGPPEPDWVAPSPLGDWLVVQWAVKGQTACRGLETYDIRTGEFVGRVHREHPHGDLGVVENWWEKPADQRQFFMTFEQNIGTVPLCVGARFLPGSKVATSTPQILLPLAWGNTGHVSCQGPPGRCLVSAGPGKDSLTPDDPTPGWQPYENELFIVGLDRSIRRLAHHRSSECGYWAQPRATWSRDGRFAIFSSDWGADECKHTPEKLGNADPYMILLAP